MSRSVDTLIHPRWVVTVNDDNQVLENHSVAINDGQIIAIVPRSEAAEFEAEQELTLDDHALMPGLVNAHTHAAMSLMRGMADDKALMDWLQNHIWPAEVRLVNPEFVALGTELAVAEMIKGGTTCFNDMYFFPEEAAKVVDATGIRGSLGIILLDFPSAYGTGPDDYLNKGMALREQYSDHARLSFVLAPHAPYTVSDGPFADVVRLSKEHDLPVHMHIHETSDEVDMAVADNGKRPLQRLTDLGLVNDKLLAVHMTQLNDEEISQLADAGTHILHCPESNLKLASGFCKVAALNDAGINVAVGTDGAASNNDLDMFGEMRTAALLAKGVASDATAVPAETALRMATINGAKALGLSDKIGSVEVGKQADLVAVDLGCLETQPVYDAVSQLVYAAGPQHVSDVWVNGKVLLKEGMLTTIDASDLLKRVADRPK